jgi:hypothetical protein
VPVLLVPSLLIVPESAPDGEVRGDGTESSSHSQAEEAFKL